MDDAYGEQVKGDVGDVKGIQLQLLDASGAVVKQIDYDSFGSIVADSASDFVRTPVAGL